MLDRTSPSWLQRPHCTVTIGGVVQDDPFEWHTDLELDRISTADITLSIPLGSEVIEGASVEIAAAAGETEAEKRVFWGRINAVESGIADSGRVAHLRCVGWAWALTLPLSEDLAFAGGAPVDARFLSADVKHVGNSTVSWFADPSPDGLEVDLTFSPHADARFVRVSGRQHGANSYREEPDRDISDFSRIEIWQSGRRKGYANLARNDERWRDRPDFSDDAEWTDFAVTIGARIDGDAGDATVRFVSGRKPGSKERDDYEVKDVTYETAGQTSASDLAKAILRNRGYGASGNGVPYRIAQVLDVNDNEVLLGGNGLIANGRVVLAEKSQPWAWLTQVMNLWGHHLVDGPDAIDLRPVWGAPDEDATPVATYEEGVNVFSVTAPRDVAQVIPEWRVYGASGTDENGEPFQYASFSDPDAIATPSYLPFAVTGEVRHEVLVSDGLARSVRQIKEIEHESLPIAVDLDVPPSPAVVPGSVIRVTMPSITQSLLVSSGGETLIDADGSPLVDDVEDGDLLWVTGVRHDWDEGGFWTSLSARAATGRRNPEADPAVDPLTQTSTVTRHVGQTDIAWYARSGADGLSVAYGFHPGGDFRGVRVTGRYHGANSFPPSTASLLREPERGIMRNYMAAVDSDGDYMNDWITHLSEPVRTDFSDYIQFVLVDGDWANDFLTHLPDWFRDFAEAVGKYAAGDGSRSAVDRFLTAGSASKPETPSSVEIWQLGTKIGSVALPHHPERYDRRQDYADDDYWADFDVMIAADIANASADVRFVSGTARDDTRDEYEVKEVQVALYAEATEQGSVSTSGADWHAYQPKRVWRWAS